MPFLITTFKLDQNINQQLTLLKCEAKVTKTQKPYVRFDFSDASGRISGNMWNVGQEKKEELESYGTVHVVAKVTNYNGVLQLNIESIEGTVSTANVFQDAQVNAGVVCEDIMALCNKYYPKAYSVLRNMNTSHLLEDIKKAPAGKSIHHAYPGGLLQHTYEVMKIAHLYMFEVMPTIKISFIDRDVVMLGAFFHDIGKIYEYEIGAGGGFEMSHAGKLLPHTVTSLKIAGDILCATIITELPEGMEEWLKNKVQEILHVIASHHGTLENGSAVVPKTAEAMIVHVADLMSSQVGKFVEEYSNSGRGWIYSKMNEQMYFPPAETAKEAPPVDDGLPF